MLGMVDDARLGEVIHIDVKKLGRISAAPASGLPAAGATARLADATDRASTGA